jgi:hypothetical protein
MAHSLPLEAERRSPQPEAVSLFREAHCEAARAGKKVDKYRLRQSATASIKNGDAVPQRRVEAREALVVTHLGGFRRPGTSQPIRQPLKHGLTFVRYRHGATVFPSRDGSFVVANALTQLRDRDTVSVDGISNQGAESAGSSAAAAVRNVAANHL